MDGLTSVALAASQGGWHPIARLGEYQDRRYGKFSITRADYEAWQRNLAQAQNGEVPIDYDHQAERGNTKAAGWVRALRLVGSRVEALIDWTPEGEQNVREGYWRYVSPTFTAHYRDEKGRDLGRALLGVALTNRPFLRQGMPALNLSAEDPFAELAAPATPPPPADGGTCPDCGQPLPDAAAGTVIECSCGQKVTMSDPTSQPPSDSTGEGEPMPEPTGAEQHPSETALDTTTPDATPDAEEGADTPSQVTMSQLTNTISLALGLSEDADESQAADAIRQLREDAAAGRDAAARLHEQTFNLAYDEGVRERRIAPAQRDRLRALYDAAPDDTLALMAEAPALVPGEPRAGTAGDDTEPREFANAGNHPVDEDRLELAAQAEKLAAERGISLTDAAILVQAGGA